MIERKLKTLIVLFLWVTLIEDVLLVLMAWFSPELWFAWFHNTVPAGLDTAFLRRSAGQWAAFALAQGIALWRWRRHPVWLPIMAGVRFSDLFTDLSYVMSAPTLTTTGKCMMLPLPLLNLAGIAIMLLGYHKIQQGRM